MDPQRWRCTGKGKEIEKTTMFSPRFWLPILLAGVLTCEAQTTPLWEELKGCRLVPEGWRDGDSFVVTTPTGNMIVRLYFVDTPEDSADTRFPERIADQAAYFGVAPEQALELGDAAADFTFRTLSKAPFSVLTCGQQAPGASSRPRTYALVRTSEGDLGELLVSRGLARIYGKRITLPDGTDSATYREMLYRLEQSAKSKRLGGWGLRGSEVGR